MDDYLSMFINGKEIKYNLDKKEIPKCFNVTKEDLYNCVNSFLGKKISPVGLTIDVFKKNPSVFLSLACFGFKSILNKTIEPGADIFKKFLTQMMKSLDKELK